jgi:hypothetical protein
LTAAATRETMLAPCQPRAMSVSAVPSLLESTDDAPRTAVEVARRWALAEGLRSGVTRCFYPSALLPLVERWAAGCGWSPPDASALGRGLAAVGIQLQHSGGRGRRLLLHRDDAARLRKLVWEAWAPRVPPGERPRNKPGRLPLQCALARLDYLRPPAPGFNEQLRLEGPAARPVVDNLGRCYPSIRYAATTLAPKRMKAKAPAQLLSALRRGGVWRNRLWRYLLPEELARVPAAAPCGVRLEELGWLAVCRNHALLTDGQSATVRSGAAQGADMAWLEEG